MAIVSFGAPVPAALSCPTLTLPLPPLSGRPVIEAWLSDRPVQPVADHGISMAMNDEWLIGTISVDERPGWSLDSLANDAYRRILHHLNRLGYPHLCRIWNYFPRINEEQDGLERYRRFCVGRHQALAELLPDFPLSLPAATAVGTPSGPLQIMFLASTRPPTHLDNPRQLNAYEYPSTYGPRSPSFARATLCRFSSRTTLFIAGTASVVGHASQHIGAPVDQTHESIRNVQAVLERASSACGTDLLSHPHHAVFKVYIRDPNHFSDIHAALHESSLPIRHCVFLQSDLCRCELLMEIEGLILLT
jgi:chorismate lyase/3-hydroxybenzoate synthase